MNEEIAKIIPPIPNQSWLRVLYKLLLLEFIHVLIKIVHTYTKLYIYMYTFKKKKNHSQKLHKDRNYEISNCSARIRLDDTVLVLSMLHSISTFHASFSIRTSIWYLYNNMYRFLILFMTFYCQKYRLGQE